MSSEPVVMTKKLLALKCGLSRSILGKYLNVYFIDELTEVGYSKEMRILTPAVVRKFIELYGEPLNEADF
jgi:hypothetical protein